jgi:hypothetical protein
MKEIIFLINEAEEEWESLFFMEGETMQELKKNIQEAIDCHFDDPSEKPKLAQIHYS